VSYLWLPPKYARESKQFRCTSLGTDYAVAFEKTEQLNAKLEEFRRSVFGEKPSLATIRPMSVAWLSRTFEKSPKFSRYSFRIKKDYPRIYRSMEITVFGSGQMFGDLPAAQVTKQLAYTIYETCTKKNGLDSANKMMSAWQAAFKYGTLKFPEITFNPFSKISKESPPARRQRWTNEQLDAFVKTAYANAQYSVGLCALMCMELMQRPGDILGLTWDAYRQSEDFVQITQSKKRVEVRVPPTERLRVELDAARTRARLQIGGPIGRTYICPTKTGRRWHRRNFAREVRAIARDAGIPDELQIRDLRRTAATEGASAGATPWEMMAVGGWQDQNSIRPYFVRTPEQAAAFQAKREAYRQRKSSQLSRD
jgi:integrase